MTFLDIHSHILPNVDDGAQDTQSAIQLLTMLKQQGVTHVIATPHFYPDTDNAEAFSTLVNEAFLKLREDTKGMDLPQMYLGCELHYFSGMGKSKSLRQFVIKGTNYILLELPYNLPITKTVLQDIIDIGEIQDLKPILAHIERYRRAKDFKKLLKLVENGYALAHINANAVISKEDARLCEKLIKQGVVSFLASDTHSVKHRPPMIKQALDAITERMGKSFANRLIIKSNRLLEEIEGVHEQ